MHVTDEELLRELPQTIDGTPLQAAAYARFETPATVGHWLGPIGNYLIVRPAARAKAHRITDDTGVPLDAAVVFGVSDSDLHVWKADPMLNQVGDHLGSVPLSRVTGAASTPGGGWSPLTITLEGGETIECSGRGSAVAALVDALGRPETPAG